MSSDPFPGTADPTLELRLAALFGSTPILFTANDPVDKREGMIWLNTSTNKLKTYGQGKTWTIGVASVDS